MNSFDPLIGTLLDLAKALESANIPLTIGGGFGLYLKQEHIAKSKQRTLLTQLPMPRSTNDIDLFVRVDVLVNQNAVQQIAAALQALEFEVVPTAEYFQWKRILDSGEVKIDFLVGPLGNYRKDLKVSKPRARPKGGQVKFHAHTTDEAIEIDTESAGVVIEGRCTDGTKYSTTVYLPQAFTYLMMKLFTFDDRKDDAESDQGRHHAMDIYRIVGMMTEDEYARTISLAHAYRLDERFHRAQRIVSDCFSAATTLGLLRLREHNLYRPTFQIDEFIQQLNSIFGSGVPASD